MIFFTFSPLFVLNISVTKSSLSDFRVLTTFPWTICKINYFFLINNKSFFMFVRD